MAIKVIGAGLGRTGTMSLKAALEELGYVKCYHMVELLGNLKQAPAWEAASRGEPVDWDAIFQGYQATVDWPGCNFYAQFMERYPDAKVILTVRDPDRWYESARQTIYHVRDTFPAWVGRLNPRIRRFMSMLDQLIWVGMFEGKFEDKTFATGVFNRHNEAVKRAVPPDRLLVYEIKEGWGPLCAFLGVPAPEGKPFPHLNDTAEFRGHTERQARIMRMVSYAVLGILVLVVVLILRRIVA